MVWAFATSVFGGKGCDGFFYGVTFDKREDEDVVFENEYENQQLNIVVDPEL